MGKQHTPDFGPAVRKSGSHLVPDEGGSGPNSYSPGWGKTPTPDFGQAVRPPTGDHMSLELESDFVPPVPTGPSASPDLSNPLK